MNLCIITGCATERLTHLGEHVPVCSAHFEEWSERRVRELQATMCECLHSEQAHYTAGGRCKGGCGCVLYRRKYLATAVAP